MEIHLSEARLTRGLTKEGTIIPAGSKTICHAKSRIITTNGDILDAIFEVVVMVLFGEVIVGGIVGGYGIGSAVGADGTAGGAILPAPHARPWKISLTQPVKVETALSQKIKGQLRR